MVVLGWLFGIAVAAAVIAVAVVFLNRFYRKSTRDVALVRTGFGGQRIVISGGCLALPVPAQGRRDQHAHHARRGAPHGGEIADHRRPHARRRRARILRAGARPRPRASRPPRRRSARNPSRPTACATCSKAASSTRIHAVAAGHTMDSLHEKRADFVRNIADLLRENLEPERHPARLGLAHPARPGAVLGASTRTTPSTPSACASSPRSSRSTRRSAPRSRPTPRSRCARPSSRRPSGACS